MSVEAIRLLREKVSANEEIDPFEDGAVIRWKRRFNQRGTTYTYAALRAGGEWWMTGRIHGTSYTFEDIVHILAEEGVFKIAVATEWESLKGKTSARTKLSAEKNQRRMHEVGVCRWSGLSFDEVSPTNDQCCCTV